MKKFTLNRRTILLKCWLLTIACQPEYHSSKLQALEEPSPFIDSLPEKLSLIDSDSSRISPNLPPSNAYNPNFEYSPPESYRSEYLQNVVPVEVTIPYPADLQPGTESVPLDSSASPTHTWNDSDVHLQFQPNDSFHVDSIEPSLTPNTPTLDDKGLEPPINPPTDIQNGPYVEPNASSEEQTPLAKEESKENTSHSELQSNTSSQTSSTSRLPEPVNIQLGTSSITILKKQSSEDQKEQFDVIGKATHPFSSVGVMDTQVVEDSSITEANIPGIADIKDNITPAYKSKEDLLPIQETKNKNSIKELHKDSNLVSQPVKDSNRRVNSPITNTEDSIEKEIAQEDPISPTLSRPPRTLPTRTLPRPTVIRTEAASDTNTTTTPGITTPITPNAPTTATEPISPRPVVTPTPPVPNVPPRPTPAIRTAIAPTPAFPAASDNIINESQQPSQIREVSINFNNVAMIEYIRFISKITNKNFIFDDVDLQFNVTIVSEEPTSVENLMAALLQELKIRDLSLMEQGNNIIIHRNPRVRSPAHIVAEGLAANTNESELVTRVFRLNTLDPIKASEIIRPLLSDDALVEVLRDSNNLIITDLVTNVNKIAQLILSLDAPNSGMTIGQYVVRNAFVDSLAILADKILQPIAQGNPFVLVPHSATNSIFIVSNPFIVERALAILENLDNNEGRTKIFSLEALRFRDQGAGLGTPGGPGAPGVPGGPGVPIVPGGNVPGVLQSGGNIGNLPGAPGVPGGTFPVGALIDRPNVMPGMFEEGREFLPGVISSAPRWSHDLPAGHIERTLFFLYKLKYRRGDSIEIALRKIADSLQIAGLANIDLIAAINSIQWIESSNSLIFTGTAQALDRLKELVEEIDLPLRQVFIEMLVLDATITDSLRYGVEYGSEFGGGNTAGSQAFIDPNAITGFKTALNNVNAVTPPNAAPFVTANPGGFTLGVIGRHLTKDGTQFNTIAALVTAVHRDTKVNIVLNPKLITEDNHTAEIFVGETARYKTQSIANDFGTVLTNNFQFLDVGTTLRVTPLIGNNDVITLDIIQEISRINPLANTFLATAGASDVNIVPVIDKNRTVTRVHVPNGFFVVLSGLISDAETRTENRVPCLGGIPIIGGFNKQKNNADDKRNLMIFIRPVIIDTEEEYEYITTRQQNIFIEKDKFRRRWNYEIDEALDFVNIKKTDPDEVGCTIR